MPAETVTTSPPADSGAITTTTKKRASPPANPPKRGTTRPTSPTTSTDPPDTNPVETSPPATDPPTTPPVVTQPPASDPPAQFETFTGIGGAITIRLEHGTMQVVDKVPSAGFIVGGNPDLSGAHVEVRFFSSSHFTKVHVDLVDGVMVSNGDERDSSGGTSGSPLATVGRIEHAPPSTDGDPSGDSSWHGGPG
ncbi:MAG: hypothetical protein ABIR68_09930 [Ilumatobacteraceae bacterium]